MKLNSNIVLFTLVLVLLNFGCELSPVKTADRPELNGKDTVTVVREGNGSVSTVAGLSDADANKYAYELGYDPAKGLTDAQKEEVILRFKVRGLERSLDSNKERIQYSKVIPYLTTDQEKFDFLSIPSIEGRQAYVNKNKIMNRSKTRGKEYFDAVEAQDIVLGMTQDLVKRSWGEPDSVEFSGNPIYKNEKWRYVRDVPTPQGYKRERRYVFFEGGRVVGWETE